MSFISFDAAPWHAGTVNILAARRSARPQGLEVFVRQALPTDSVGTFTLTLQNVVVGSAVQVEVASTGAVVSNTTASSATVVLALQAYAPGSANNDLRIKVRKGSGSPYYVPYETLTTAVSGSQTIYVSQIPDE